MQLIAEFSCDGTAVRNRSPGTAELNELAGELEAWGAAQGGAVHAYRFGREEILPSGAQPTSPYVQIEDIQELKLPVVQIAFGEPSASVRVMLVTTVESLEDAPLESSGRAKLPSPSSDLSASGAAVIMEAIERTTIPGNLYLEVVFHSGSLVYRNWSGMTVFPYLNEIGRAEVAQFDAIVGIQQIGQCDRPIAQNGFSNRHADTMELFASLASAAKPYDIPFNFTPVWGKALDERDFGFHSHAGVVYAQQAPAVLLSGTWWDHEGPAGSLDDRPENICELAIQNWVRFVSSMISSQAWIP